MTAQRPSPATRYAVRGLTTNLVAGFLVLYSLITGAVMVLVPQGFLAQPRFTHLQLALHSVHASLVTFGWVLIVAGAVKGAAALAGWLWIRLVATGVCALWWLINATSQWTYLHNSGDIPAATGTTGWVLLFVLHGAAQVVYLREIHSRGD